MLALNLIFPFYLICDFDVLNLSKPQFSSPMEYLFSELL